MSASCITPALELAARLAIVRHYDLPQRCAAHWSTTLLARSAQYYKVEGGNWPVVWNEMADRNGGIHLHLSDEPPPYDHGVRLVSDLIPGDPGFYPELQAFLQDNAPHFGEWYLHKPKPAVHVIFGS